MNAGAPTCPSCGGLNTNPQSAQCRFCGQMLPQQGYGAAPMGYGAPQGAPPMGGYGAPQGYGAPGYGAPQGYGAPPPGGYGAPMPQGYAPNPYGAPNPYAQPYPVVQPFNGGGGYIQQSSWSSGWSAFFWIRLGIAVFVVVISLMGACVSAIAH